jgi:hypothetical protein
MGSLSPLSAPDVVTVAIDWKTPLHTVSMSATIEVDIMPFLARVPEGGTFPGYYEALTDLGAARVHLNTWIAYPRVSVMELTPANCSKKGGRGSSWNTTVLDLAMADFMAAAAGRSVVTQLSTIPAWMFAGGEAAVDLAVIPADPWQYPSGPLGWYMKNVSGLPLRDPSCREMARYAARYVGWFTAGGFVDECGIQHSSGLHYDWDLLSVLNEDEYQTPPGGGVQYTTCWDAWKEEIGKVHGPSRVQPLPRTT